MTARARGRSSSTAAAAAAGATATAPAECRPAGGAALLPVTLTVAPARPRGRRDGLVVLTQGTRSRRIPYWVHVERPRLATATCPPPASRCRARIDARPARPRSALPLPGLHRRARLPVSWRGGEKLYRFRLAERAINVGVTVEPLAGGGLRPFLLRGLDENRVAGESGLPIDVGPSLTDDPLPSAGLYGAPPGDYAVRRLGEAARRGIPAALLGQRRHAARARPPARLPRCGALRVPVSDAGSGVDPRYLECALVQEGSSEDRACRPDWDVRTGVATILVERLPAGRYALSLRTGDYARVADALAISISPQPRTHARDRPDRGCARRHQRRRRTRLRRASTRGARWVAATPPVLDCWGHGRSDPVHAWCSERRHASRRRPARALATAMEREPAVALSYSPGGHPGLRSWIGERHGVPPERVVAANGCSRCSCSSPTCCSRARPRSACSSRRPPTTAAS